MNLTLLLFLLPSVWTTPGLVVSDAAGLVLSIKQIIGLEFVFFDISNYEKQEILCKVRILNNILTFATLLSLSPSCSSWLLEKSSCTLSCR